MVPGAGVGVRGDSRGKYKYQRLRERLRDAIRRRELTGKLPGERELARRYTANAKTINKALADLTVEGLLVRHVGRGTFVAGDGTPETQRWDKPRTFGWLDVAPEAAHRQQICRMAAELVGRKGHRVEFLSVMPAADGCVSRAVLTPAHLRTWEGVVLTGARPSDDFVAELHRRHVPVVLTNNTHPRIKSFTVLPDYSQGVFELCRHLIQLGHERLQLLICPAMLPAASAGEMGYRAAMQRYGLKARPPIYPGVDAELSRILTEPERPTGVVCIGGSLAAGLMRATEKERLSPPRELGLGCLPEPGEAILADTSITTYEIPLDAVAYWTAELLLGASPGQAPRVVIVPGHLTDRGSSAPPVKRGQAAHTQTLV